MSGTRILAARRGCQNRYASSGLLVTPKLDLVIALGGSDYALRGYSQVRDSDISRWDLFKRTILILLEAETSPLPPAFSEEQ